MHGYIRRTYLPEAIYFVTTDIVNHQRHFSDSYIASFLKSNIFLSRTLLDFVVFAFVIMPDHFHILLQPKEKTISEIMHSIKRNSSRDIHRLIKNLHSGGSQTSAMSKNQNFQWQKSFYDHIIKDEKDFLQHIEYIKNNPVKAGLVGRAEEYLFLYVDEDAIAQVLGY